jgi:hypothetical protein
MKVIGIGKTSCGGRPEQLIVEITDNEFAQLVGHYSLYSNNCPSPTVGTEFQINEIFGKAVTLKHAKYSCEQIKDHVEKLMAALPTNFSSN